MTRNDLERALAELPFRLLRRLARSTVGPHILRSGKRRMIHAILAVSETNPERIDAAIRTARAEQQAIEAVPAIVPDADAAQKNKPVDLGTFLEGLGVPEPKPFVPDPWQLEALKVFASPDPDKRRISLQACVGPGKSTVLAWCAWNFLACYGETGEHPNPWAF